MTKRRTLPTRALGAEPGLPDLPVLAAWVAEHRGEPGDLISFRIAQSLAPQLSAGITMPCFGGKFYRDRIMACLMNMKDDRVIDEIGVSTGSVIEDAAHEVARNKGVWCALPAPHLLGITDAYYHDEDEWRGAISGAYRTMMRSMRDAGIGGHVLICDRADHAELSALARRKVFFFQPEPDREGLQTMMEYQQQIAVSPAHLDTLFDIAHEYDLSRVIVLDADKESIDRALAHLDHDQVAIGGYCTEHCEEYWESVVGTAWYNV
jgi:hypothetical protein